jgi:two-component system, cell cycle response regulator DivK
MAVPTPVILVVEDNAVNSELTLKILSSIGVPTVLKENGEEAIEWCREHLPQLILMDISLPGLDGLEVTRKLRTMPDLAEVPILALTAHALGDWEERTRAAGCTAYLAKPIRPRDLTDVVRKYLPTPPSP